MSSAVPPAYLVKKQSGVFALAKITRKIQLLIGSFLVILTVITLVLFFQNYRTSKIISQIETLRVPVPIATADIISGLNRVSAAQRAYVLTGDDWFKREQIEVWQEQIEPALLALAELGEQLPSKEERRSVETALRRADQYREAQEQVNSFFEKNLKDLEINPNAVDSIRYPAFISQLALKNQREKELEALITGDASALRKEIRYLLMPLNNVQEQLLFADVAEIKDNMQRDSITLIVLTLTAAAIFSVLGRVISKDFQQSIQKPIGLLESLAQGQIPEHIPTTRNEFNTIMQVGGQLANNLRKASDFAQKIGEGQFEHAFHPASYQDVLGNSLIQMRDRLKSVGEEDRKRNWVATGLAQLGDMLRRDYREEKHLYDEILAFLIKYQGANQGALFLTDNEDQNEPVLRLVACYAYGKKKHMQRTVEPGEGLVGQAYVERDTLLLTDIPDDHLKITSGLGESMPKSLLVTPLVVNEEIYGVIELASFKQFEKYEVEFMQKLSEQLAAALSKVKVNAKTVMLLKESQRLTGQLTSQEEELRQNMEELRTTQEDLARKESEISGQLMAIDYTMAIIEFNVDGTILLVNDRFLRAMGYTREEVQYQHHRLFVHSDYAASAEYAHFWNELNRGVAQIGEFCRVGKNGREVWINASYTPVKNTRGEIYKIIKLAHDITERKKLSLDYEGQITAIYKSSAVVEFDLRGVILTANDIFVDLMGYADASELVGQHHKLFVFEEDRQSEVYQKFWAQLQTGTFTNGEFRRKRANGSQIWIRGSYNPIIGLDGKPYKVVKYAYALTEKKSPAAELPINLL